MQFLALLLQQPLRITRRPERVPEVRKLHQPKHVLAIIRTPHAKSDPARIGNPGMLLNQTFCQKRITYRAGERDIHDAARMDVRNFCVSESEFPTSKTMWMNRYFRPRGEFCFELLQKVHPSQLQRLYFRCLKTTARFNKTRSAFHPSLELRFATSGGGTHHAASIRAQYSANARRCLRPGATGSDRLRHGGRGTVKQIENGQQITDKVA